MKNYRDTRLLEMLDYIDPKYIENTKKYYRSVPAKGANNAKIDPKKQIKYIVALAACLLLLSAFIPAVTYIIQNHFGIAGIGDTTGGDTTLAPEITSEDITSSPEPESSAPETTEPEPEHETTEPLYDGTTASPEAEYDGSRGLVYKIADDGRSAWLFGMGICTDEDIVVASTYNGVPVTAIGEVALADYPRVRSVTVPGTVTAIDMRAFKNCTGLESVTIPDSVSFIGGDAFENCLMLKKITLPAGLERLETTLFANCIGLEELVIPANLKSISAQVFYDCSSLRELEYLGSVAEWNAIAKDEDWNQKSSIVVVHCADGDVKIKTEPEPEPEPEYDGSRGLEYQIEGDHAVLVGIGTCTDKEIIVASTYNGLPVTAIGRRAICGVEGVTGIVISDTVTHLDFMAISHCYDLESIHIPANLTVMEESAIISFGNIRSITVDPKNPRYYSVNNCLIDRVTKTLLLGCDTSIIPIDGSIGIIAPNAFTMCKGIESITIPEGVTKIGRDAFYKCSSLRSVELPESLITIESSAFSNCPSLEKVKLGGKVEYMGEYAFSECEKLGEIILPDSLSFLGNYAFQGCTALKRAVLSKNLETLELMIFASCNNLESVIIPEGVKSIGTDAFSDTALKELNMPASIKEIRQGAFEYCESLMSVSFAGTVSEWIAVEKDVGWHTVGTFKVISCSDGDVKLYSDSEDGGSIGLEYEINADGKGVRLIGEGICTDARIVIASKFHGIPVTEIDFVAFSFCSFIEEIAIPESVTVIRSGAFRYCNNLKKVTLPSALEYISDSVFADCESLESIVIPRKVKRIDTWAFRNCKKLTEFAFAGTVAEWYAIEKGRGNDWNEGCPFTVVHCLDGDAEVNEYDGSRGLLYTISLDGTYAYLYGIGTCTDENIVIASSYMGVPVKAMTAALRDKTFIKSIVLPEGMEEIPSSAFSGCTSLEYVRIPNTVKSIGSHAFSQCTSLTDIELPNSVESIGEYAFGWCSSLKKLKIPESVTYVGSDILYACDSIDEIFIPKSVTNLGLPDSTDISKFKIDPQNPKYSFKGNCIIDKETKTLLRIYENAVLPDDGSIEIIGEEAIGWSYGAITELILPEGVRYMQNSGFYGFDGIEYLHLPSTFEGFDEYALGDTYDLKKITVAKDNPYYYVAGDCLIDKRTGTVIIGLGTSVIPDDGSIKHIGQRAFAESAIESVKIPEGVISIGGAAFYECTSIKEVILPESLERIGYNAFALCSSLKTIKIGENVKIIEGNAFSDCYALEEIILPKQVESLGDGAFGYCSSLRYIILPSGSEGEDFLFTHCTNLEEVVLPDGMNQIGSLFFAYCENLKNIEIPESVTEIYYNAFYQCTSLESIVIPRSVGLIDQNAFSNCEVLKDFRFAGTVEEWNAIEKGKNWNSNAAFTVVHCIDGDATP